MDNEEEFLNTFFTLVSQLSYEKAKENVERERESNRPGQPSSWGMLLTHLPQIAVVEKSYLELGFLVSRNKGFLRKDTSLRSVYDSLRTDFRRLEEMARLTGVSADKVIIAVSNHLSQFLTARIELIDFYEKMQVMGSWKQIRFEELLAHIEDIVDRNAMNFSHMVLTSIKATLSLECEILVHLLQAQIEMQQWNFLQSLMLLNKANTRIVAWEQTLQNRESWKLGFGAAFLKASQPPALFQWLVKLKSAFLSKFSLYFYMTLSQQAAPQELKSVLTKQGFDYLHKMQSYQKRYDATAVMLLLDTQSSPSFHGAGYHLPDKPDESVGDVEPFYIIISYPIKPLNHMPNIVKILTERSAELVAMDKVVHVFSPKDQNTYFLSLIDPRISLIVVFETKKGEKDSYASHFVNELSTQLRCTKVFANLKLNAK